MDPKKGPNYLPTNANRPKKYPEMAQITCQQMRLPLDCQTGVVLPEVQGLALELNSGGAVSPPPHILTYHWPV